MVDYEDEILKKYGSRFDRAVNAVMSLEEAVEHIGICEEYAMLGEWKIVMHNILAAKNKLAKWQGEDKCMRGIVKGFVENDIYLINEYLYDPANNKDWETWSLNYDTVDENISENLYYAFLSCIEHCK